MKNAKYLNVFAACALNSGPHVTALKSTHHEARPNAPILVYLGAHAAAASLTMRRHCGLCSSCCSLFYR